MVCRGGFFTNPWVFFRSWTLTTRSPDSRPWPKSPGRPGTISSKVGPAGIPMNPESVVGVVGCGGCCCCCCCLLLFVVVVVVVVVVFVVVLALRTRQVFVPLPPPRPRRLPGATIMMTLPALEPTERAFGTNQGKKWSNGGEKGD